MDSRPHGGVVSLRSRAGLAYLLYVPETRPGDTLPLLLFLHGAGESGPGDAWRVCAQAARLSG